MSIKWFAVTAALLGFVLLAEAQPIAAEMSAGMAKLSIECSAAQPSERSAPVQLLFDWQTLVTGVLALIAAVGTIWATVHSANRQVAAAQAQVGAAQNQVTVAKEQIALADLATRRRTVEQYYAFFITMEAAMKIVIEDSDAAEKMERGPGTMGLTPSDRSPVFYAARHRIKKSGFIELRSACLRLGSDLILPLLRLDDDIDNLAVDSIVQEYGGAQQQVAARAGAELGKISKQAVALRDEAAKGVELWRTELAKIRSR